MIANLKKVTRTYLSLFLIHEAENSCNVFNDPNIKYEEFWIDFVIKLSIVYYIDCNIV